jgi:hypothetical protein
MALLTRSAILEAEDLKRETVAVPEWGGEVIVSCMTGTQRDAWEQSLVANKTAALANIRARLLAYSLIDDAGNLLFSEKDIEALGKKSAAAIDRVVNVAQRLNRLTNESLEELQKN